MKMRWLLPLLTILILSLSPIALAKSNNHHKKASVNGKDKEIVAYLIVIDKNEIAAANLAKEKQVDGPVKGYAQFLDKEHTKNLNQTMKLVKVLHAKPHETEGVKDVKAEGKEQLSSLESLSGKAFQEAYMKAMVKDHADALDLIDNQLLANVNNNKLKQHLKDTRKHVAEHLEKAKQVQSELNE